MAGAQLPGPLSATIRPIGADNGLLLRSNSFDMPGPLGILPLAQIRNNLGKGGPAPNSTTYIYPRTLNIHLAVYWVSNFPPNTFNQKLISQAAKLLSEHGATLRCWPSETPNQPATIRFPDRLVERNDYDSLLDAASTIIPSDLAPRYLAAFICQFHYPAAGLTVSDTETRCLAKPFILVDPTGASDNVTLLHEVGHAAGLSHDRTDPRHQNFMDEAGGHRSTLYRWQIERLAGAFFASS